VGRFTNHAKSIVNGKNEVTVMVNFGKDRKAGYLSSAGIKILTGTLLAVLSSQVWAHSDGGKLSAPPGATAIAQTICGSNSSGETATYSFRIRNLSAAYKDQVKVVVTKDGFAPQEALTSKRVRAYGGWGLLPGGNGVYTLTFSKVLAKSANRKPVVFELEHHCSAANGGHTENESFVWIKR
jgi:hypothetical protein